MAGVLKVDTLESDSNLALKIATANVAFIDSNGLNVVGGNLTIGATQFATGGQIQTAGIADDAVTSDKILSVANTKISGNITSSQIAPSQTFYGNTSLTGLLDLSSTNAGQIKFPASQNASSNANTLDDYEEGSWTPDLRFGGGTTGITYSTRTGKYIKIGNLVQAQFRITLTNKGASSGGAQVFGLPFASKEEFGGAVFGYVDSLTNNSSWNSAPQIPTLDTNSSYVFLRYISGGGNAAHTDGDFTNTSDIIMTATYITS